MDILVPLDGSKQSLWSTQVAADLAGRRHRLDLMHVIDHRFVQPMGAALDNLTAVPTMTEEDNDLFAFYAEEGKEILSVAADLCAEAGVCHRRRTPIGIPCNTIVAQSRSADCVILAKQGFSSRDLGVTASHVIAEAKCPVLSLRTYRTVRHALVVLDHLEACLRLIEVAAELMHDPGGRVTTLLQPSGSDWLRRFEERIAELGLTHTSRVVDGDIIEAALAEAAAEHIDLIVLAGAARLPAGLIRRELAAVRVARRATCMTLSAPGLARGQGRGY